jgi:hypothetical protein
MLFATPSSVCSLLQTSSNARQSYMNNHGPHEAPGLHVKERLWWLVWNLTFHWPSRVIGQTMSVPPPCRALLLDLFESLIWLVDWILDSSCRYNWRLLSELGSSWDGMATLGRSIPPLPGLARMSEIVITVFRRPIASARIWKRKKHLGHLPPQPCILSLSQVIIQNRHSCPNSLPNLSREIQALIAL